MLYLCVVVYVCTCLYVCVGVCIDEVRAGVGVSVCECVSA